MMMVKKLILLTLILFLFTPKTTFAHQPRIPEGDLITVENPEISKAYYGQLKGKEHIYKISSQIPFNLFVSLLVPDIAQQKKDISAKIIKDGNTNEPVAILDGNNFKWTQFFEPFGYDSYWQGPEYEIQTDPGEYDILVSSTYNDSKYSLATGKIEAFDFSETVNALNLIPQIKRDFFNKSPINFIFSPFGWGLILTMFILAFVFGFIYRLILKKIATSKIRSAHHNIGKSDRFLRFIIGIVLFVWAITTSWSPILLFFSGFIFFEAIFSWCGFYAAIGKNTCPINS